MEKTEDMISNIEQVFCSLDNVSYYFEEGTIKEHLVIIFSAVNPPNVFNYNYINTLKYLNVNKLFILDKYGEQGAYYLGENNSHSIETSVVSLINSIIKKYEIKLGNVITIGSSKGGYAALYYAIKYSYGSVIAGGPQTKLGDFLFDQGENYNIAEFILGDLSIEGKQRLNDLLFKILPQQKDNLPKIYLHVGIGDHHYKNHVNPLVRKLDELGENRYILDVQEYYSHDGIRKYFPFFISSSLSSILNIPTEEFHVIKYVNIEIDSEILRVECEIQCNDKSKVQYAYYIYLEGVILEKIFYTFDNVLEYRISKKGIYKCKVFVKDHENKKYTQMSEEIPYLS
ncbi:accessory Sec system protein Asp2 [Paenibacillus sp. GCM10027629]|uniref:accessory Sec system protein Asp2 n=1 Tax=Paenibacillus sp. GCM10027629 TaxID=3273414 RepID=UPI003641A194